jgi:hypothetical protein
MAEHMVVRSRTRRTVMNEVDERHPDGRATVGGLNPHLVGRTPEVERLLQTGELVELKSAEARKWAEEQQKVLHDMGQGFREEPMAPELVRLAEHERAEQRRIEEGTAMEVPPQPAREPARAERRG